MSFPLKTEKNRSGVYEIVKDRKKAIMRAMDIAKDGDIIIFSGKGHQHYEEIEGIKYPLNEKEIIEEYAKVKKEGNK